VPAIDRRASHGALNAPVPGTPSSSDPRPPPAGRGGSPALRAEHAGPAPGILSPWTLLGGLAGVAGLAIAGAPAWAAAALVLALVAAATFRHPANGLAALVLALPFLLGEPKTVYFLLEPVLVALVLLGCVGHRLAGRVVFVPVHGAAILGLIVAAAIALPLDLRDLLEDFWLIRSLDWGMMTVQGIPDISPLKYLDRVLVLALAGGLFAAAAQPALGGAVVAALRPLAVVVASLAGFGLLRFFGWIETRGEYLTLSFHTWRQPDLRLTGVAWNPDYFALLLVLTIPVFLALALSPGLGAVVRSLGAAAGALGSVALVYTFQRAAYLSLVAALGVLAVLLHRVRRASDARWLLGAGVLLMVVVALDAFALQGRALRRLGWLTEDPNRLRLWQTALRMVIDHPVLGVGTGRYAFFFHEYAGELGRGFGPFWGTAHSLYLHLLAEQGVVGLASFVAVFGGLWWATARRLGAVDGVGAVTLAALLAALAGWLVYGVVQFTFRIPALVYFAALLSGAAAALAPTEPRRLSRRTLLVGLAVALALLGGRAVEALRRPVSSGYQTGFYRWERQPDGRPARWTRGRAAFSTPVRGANLELTFRAPIHGVAAHPQRVRVWLNGRLTPELVLATPGWHTIVLPVDQTSGESLLIEVEPGYTFVPSRVSPSRDDRRLGVMMGELAWR
jgi:O-antigen ligase